MKRIILPLIVSLISAGWVAAEAPSGLYTFERAISWEKLGIDADVGFSVAKAGLKLPSGRMEAEENCAAAFPRLVHDTLLDLPVDSSTTVRDLVDAGTLHLKEVRHLSDGAQRRSAALSEDFSAFKVRYRIDMKELFAGIATHRHRAEPPRPLESHESRSYTGIIIYANESLPVHGTHTSKLARACLFPKIWDSEMTLVYERNMVEGAVARERGIVHYTADPESGDLADIVGDRPLSILAEGLFGSLPTDPVISHEDALTILSSADNRALLASGRVVIIITQEAVTSF